MSRLHAYFHDLGDYLGEAATCVNSLGGTFFAGGNTYSGDGGCFVFDGSETVQPDDAYNISDVNADGFFAGAFFDGSQVGAMIYAYETAQVIRFPSSASAYPRAQADSINSSGVAAGYSHVDHAPDGSVYQRHVTTFDISGSSSDAGCWTTEADKIPINYKGDLMASPSQWGGIEPYDGELDVALRTNGSWEYLRPPAGTWSKSLAVNDKGDCLVQVRYTPSNITYDTYLRTGTTWQRIAIGGSKCLGWTMNNRGDIVGTVANTDIGFVRYADGTFVLLPYLTSPLDIDDNGLVVGTYRTAAGDAPRAFLFYVEIDAEGVALPRGGGGRLLRGAFVSTYGAIEYEIVPESRSPLRYQAYSSSGNVLYAIAKRDIGGKEMRYIERMHAPYTERS